MKSYSNVRPPVFQDLGDGSWYYNFNIEVPAIADSLQEESGNETTFEYDTVHIWGKPEYEELVPVVIAAQYTPSKETSLINKYNAYVLNISTNIQDKENYEEYLLKTFEIKEMVKKDLQDFFN